MLALESCGDFGADSMENHLGEFGRIVARCGGLASDFISRGAAARARVMCRFQRGFEGE